VLRHLFGPNGPCIKLGPLGTRPRVRERPQHPCGCPLPLLIAFFTAKNNRVLFRSKYSVATLPSWSRDRLDRRIACYWTPLVLLLLIQSIIFDLQIELLVHLVLASSRLLAGTNTLVVGLIVHPSRFTTASGVGVTIAKAQHPWIVVVGSPMSLHPIDLSLSSKDRDTLEHIKQFSPRYISSMNIHSPGLG
jgi:hypothetical protein